MKLKPSEPVAKTDPKTNFMQVIKNKNIPTPNGHYATCIKHKGLLCLSGQLPLIPSNKKIPEGIVAQMKFGLENIKNILVAAGSAVDQVLQVFPTLKIGLVLYNVYAYFFGTHRPTRCIISVSTLHYRALIEI